MTRKAKTFLIVSTFWVWPLVLVFMWPAGLMMLVAKHLEIDDPFVLYLSTVGVEITYIAAIAIIDIFF